MKISSYSTKTRGASVYDAIEAEGWHSMSSPHHMRSYDCFRKGKRRAYISWERTPEVTFYYAVEAVPGRDSFNRPEWKPFAAILFDGNTPPELRATINSIFEEQK